MIAIVKDVIGIQGKNKIRWNTPCGSEIIQRYNKSETKPIQTFAMGGANHYKVKQCNQEAYAQGAIELSVVREDENEVHAGDHALGLSPNYHHSLDAYICQQAILLAGTDNIATCHDCFYYRPGEVVRGVKGVKDAFYKLVTSDVLQNLLETNEVEGMLVPRYGDDTLLDNFFDSKYCFH